MKGLESLHLHCNLSHTCAEAVH